MSEQLIISRTRSAHLLTESSCELQQLNGLALGENYSNAKGCQMFMNIIASFLREENKLDLGLYVVVVVVNSTATRRKFLASW